MTELAQAVGRNIRRRRLLRDGQRVLVATSGGLDSMVLLRVLGELAPEHGWELTVAHLNHQLRGRSSEADERLVRRAAKQLGWPFVSERADVRGHSRVHGLSVEMSARKVRHDFLARTAVRLGIPAIALAHHADDQTELFFLRLLRGTGGQGLAGMKWRNPSPSGRRVFLVRPLLDQPKSVLADYAAREKVPFREDASNGRRDIPRNRIRHELLPLLRREYQPALDRTIPRVMDILGAEAEFVGQAAEEWLAEARKMGYRPSEMAKRGPETIGFEELAVAVQRQSIQLQLIEEGVVPDFELVEHLRVGADRPVTLSGAQVGQKSSAIRVFRDARGLVHLERMPTAAFRPEFVELDLGKRAGQVLFGGVSFLWRRTVQTGRRLRRQAGRELFDADRVGRRVVLRHWQPGDRFQPIGMATAVKLQDLFTGQKVPRQRRHELVVAATGQGAVFWVEGLRISERYKLTGQTKRRLHWRWQRL